MKDTNTQSAAPSGFGGAVLRTLPAVAVAVGLLTTVGWHVAKPLDPDWAVTLTRSGRGILAIAPSLLILTIVVAAVGTALSGRRVPQGGVFATAIGLAMLSLRGGSMQVVLAYCGSNQAGPRRSLMVSMAIECLLWAAMLAVSWIVVEGVWRWLWASGADDSGEAEAPKLQKSARGPRPGNAGPRAGWPALAVTSVVALFVIWMTIARSPVATIARGQVIASVAGGLYLGVLAARYFTGIRNPRWYVLAPLVVALVGYLLGFLQADLGWAKGPLASYARLATTPAHALARPLPIEYIAVGVAGAIAGLWSGEKIEHVARQETS